MIHLSTCILTVDDVSYSHGYQRNQQIDSYPMCMVRTWRPLRSRNSQNTIRRTTQARRLPRCTRGNRSADSATSGQGSAMRLPFISFRKQERRYRAFLREWTGRDARNIRKQEAEDNEFLCREMTYTEMQEVFNAGWDAACQTIKGSK